MVFDLPGGAAGAGGTGVGGSGVGGSAGSGGTTTGTGTAGCTEQVDVGPLVIGTWGREPAIAAHGARFGIVYSSTLTADQENFVLIERSGQVVGQIDAIVDDSFDASAIAASGSALFVSRQQGANLALLQYDPDDGHRANVVDVPGTTNPIHPMLTGSASGVLLTYIDQVEPGPDHFVHASFLADGGGPLSTPSLFPEEVVCCAMRDWYVAGDGSQFGAIWDSHSGGAYVPISGQGIAGATATPVGFNNYPTMAGSVGTDFWFASCSQLMVLTVGGQIVHDVQLGGGPCAVSSTGSALRWLQREDNTMTWYHLDAATGGTAEITSWNAPDAAGPPAVAFDGSGFGVVWTDGSYDVYYAHVSGCGG